MATAAVRVEGIVNQRRPRRRVKQRVGETIHGSRTLTGDEGEALRLDASARFRARHLQRRLERTIKRHEGAPDRKSVAIAMLAVEERLVEAYWVLGRSTTNPGPQRQAKHGIDYILDRDDKWAAAVAGGGWLTQPSTPPPATPREVDRADEALEWLQILPAEQKAIVSIGARLKNGDIARRVNWGIARLRLPEYSHLSSDRLRRIYKDGLRAIAARIVVFRSQ